MVQPIVGMCVVKIFGGLEKSYWSLQQISMERTHENKHVSELPMGIIKKTFYPKQNFPVQTQM